MTSALAQVHDPEVQTAFCGHTFPHEPQFLRSVATSVQTPLHMAPHGGGIAAPSRDVVLVAAASGSAHPLAQSLLSSSSRPLMDSQATWATASMTV
jgi:hypothetical protein